MPLRAFPCLWQRNKPRMYANQREKLITTKVSKEHEEKIAFPLYFFVLFVVKKLVYICAN